jgi:hypothetical protein
VISLKLVAWTWFTMIGVAATLVIGVGLSALGHRKKVSRLPTTSSP